MTGNEWNQDGYPRYTARLLIYKSVSTSLTVMMGWSSFGMWKNVIMHTMATTTTCSNWLLSHEWGCQDAMLSAHTIRLHDWHDSQDAHVSRSKRDPHLVGQPPECYEQIADARERLSKLENETADDKCEHRTRDYSYLCERQSAISTVSNHRGSTASGRTHKAWQSEGEGI